jgi:YfiH family protein
MITNQIKHLPFYTFKQLVNFPELRHGVFSKIAPNDYLPEFNLAFNGEKNYENALNNIRLAESVLNLPPSSFVKQTHHDNILILSPGQIYQPKHPDQVLDDYDALIGFPGQTLLIKLADCQGILLYHPLNRILALIHSGWRGSILNIIGKTVNLLKEKLNLNPKDLLACISPSLGPCCAEFIHYQDELPKTFWPFKNPHNNNFDFWAISRQQLTQAGLKDENIELSGICTRCNTNFFSYRRQDSGRFGLMAGVVL